MPKEIREEAYLYIKEGGFPLDLLSDTAEKGEKESDRARYKELATQRSHAYENMRDGISNTFTGKAYPYHLPLDYTPLGPEASPEEQRLNQIGPNNRIARNEVVELLENPVLRKLLRDGQLEVETVLELPGSPAATPNTTALTRNSQTPTPPIKPTQNNR